MQYNTLHPTRHVIGGGTSELWVLQKLRDPAEGLGCAVATCSTIRRGTGLRVITEVHLNIIAAADTVYLVTAIYRSGGISISLIDS